MILGLFVGVAWVSLGMMAAIAVGRASAIGAGAMPCAAERRR